MTPDLLHMRTINWKRKCWDSGNLRNSSLLQPPTPSYKVQHASVATLGICIYCHKSCQHSVPLLLSKWRSVPTTNLKICSRDSLPSDHQTLSITLFLWLEELKGEIIKTWLLQSCLEEVLPLGWCSSILLFNVNLPMSSCAPAILYLKSKRITQYKKL
jgi:hypothetical protein